MAFDEELATRVRKALSKNSRISEKHMFGGIAFFLNGNMCCGVHKDSLIVRLDPAQSAAALKERHTKVFDLTGRPMRGWILVAAKGVADSKALGAWLRRAAAYVDGLPAK